MIRLILGLYILICQLCAISMLILKLLSGYVLGLKKSLTLMKRHRIIAIIYITCGAIGLFYAIAHV